MPAPSVASVGTFLALGSSTSAAVPVPAGVTSGDVIYVVLYLEASRTITPPAGFTAVTGNPSATANQWEYLFWKRATAADSGTYTFSWTTAATRSARAFRVVDAFATGTPHDTPNRVVRTSSATATPAVTVTTAGPDRLLLWFATNYNAGTWTPPTGYTELADNGEITAASATKAVAGSTGSVTGTGSASGPMTASLIAVIPGIAAVQNITVAGITSAEAVGAHTLTTGPISVTTSGVASAEAVGTPQLATLVTAVGVPSAEAVGAPTVALGGAAPSGVPSAEAVGTPTVRLAALGAAGVPSAEAVPTPAVAVGPTTATPTGVPSAEVVPAPHLSMRLYVTGIASTAAVGSPSLAVSSIAVYLTGVPSAEAVGTPELTVTIDPTSRQRPQAPRAVPLYEVLVVGRVPSQAGAPTFLDVDPINWSKITWSSTLSRPQTMTVTCKTSTITEPIAQRLRSPDRLPTELWLSRNGRRVFSGPLLGGTRNGDQITLQAGGLLTYLQWMVVAADMRFDQVDQFAIAAALIDQWQALDFGHFGIDTSTVGASGVLRDRSYVRNEIHQVGRRVEELGAVRDGFDAEIDPATRKLQLWYPGKGVDRSTGDEAIVFDARNIDDQNGMFSVAPGDLASEALGSGSKAGGESSLWSEQSNAELRAAFGRTAITGAWSDVEEQGTLDDHVGSLLDSRDQPLRAPGQKVRVPPDADLDDYEEGDIVSYELDDLLGIGGAWRIRSRAVSVEQTGVESVDLEFV